MINISLRPRVSPNQKSSTGHDISQPLGTSYITLRNVNRPETLTNEEEQMTNDDPH